MKPKLRLAPAGPSSLGRPTIMDPALAQRHGVAYVHLVAFAIDVDRVREHLEHFDDPRPFGWEVFLTEVQLLRCLDPVRRPEEVLLLEDIVLSVIDGAVDALGAQIVFSIWDAIERGRAPERLRGAFASWEARPDELVREMAPLFEAEPTLAGELAEHCLAADVEPALVPPTRDALRRLIPSP